MQYNGSRTVNGTSAVSPSPVSTAEYLDHFTVKGTEIPTRKVLSPAAIEAIKAGLKSNTFKGSREALEPAYMLPDTSPDKYSMVCTVLPEFTDDAHMPKWCSFCFDFADILLLCAGCRVGVCSTSPISSRGCALWDEKIDDSDFIFYCPDCCRSLRKLGQVSASRRWTLADPHPHLCRSC